MHDHEICKSLSILGLFGFKYFTVYDSLKSGTHRHNQMLSFLLWHALGYTGADFICCLFMDLSAFSFICSIRLRSGDWLRHLRKLQFFAVRSSWVAFSVCFGSLSICTVLSVLQHLPESEQNVYPYTLHPANSIKNHIISKLHDCVLLAAHAITVPPQSLSDNVVSMLWMSSSFPSPHSPFPITLVS